MGAGITLTSWQYGVFGLYAVVLAATIARHLLCHAIIRHTTFLTPKSPSVAADRAPTVSIIVPAKDEAANIESCLISLLAQDYPDFEIIVVDDRSEDETARIAESVAARDRRVSVVRITSLPEGWTGKNHALHIAQSHARGEWLLFVDADVTLHPACLGVVVHDAEENGSGMASLLPRLEMRSFWERVIQPLAGTLLMSMFPLPRVNDINTAAYGFANGQFLMVRRDAYDAIGGHESVRDKFCEDINLGRLAKRHRLGLRVTMAPDLMGVRMYSSLPQIMRGWKRIFYAAADAKAAVLVAMAVAVFLLSGIPYIVLPICLATIALGAAGTFTWIVLGLTVLQEMSQTVLYLRAYRVSHSPVRLLAWRWLGTATMLVILAQTIRLCRTHRVEWRGTCYATFNQADAAAAPQRAAA